MGTSILIRSKQEKEIKNIRDLLYLIFNNPKVRLENPENMSMKAEEFLNLCRDRKAEVTRWRENWELLEITKSQYYNMLTKLIGAGLIERKEGLYVPSRNFTRYLYRLEEIWEDWR